MRHLHQVPKQSLAFIPARILEKRLESAEQARSKALKGSASSDSNGSPNNQTPPHIPSCVRSAFPLAGDQPYAPITIPKGSSFKDMVALKGKSELPGVRVGGPLDGSTPASASILGRLAVVEPFRAGLHLGLRPIAGWSSVHLFLISNETDPQRGK